MSENSQSSVEQQHNEKLLFGVITHVMCIYSLLFVYAVVLPMTCIILSSVSHFSVYYLLSRPVCFLTLVDVKENSEGFLPG